jgi:hypothetical protein
MVESVSLVLGELFAEVKSLERQMEQQSPLPYILELDRLSDQLKNSQDFSELITLLNSFGLEKMGLPQPETESQSGPVDRNSLTPSSISTPLFRDSLFDREDSMIKSNKKTQSDLQMIQYDIDSKGMFWMEDRLSESDQYFLLKVSRFISLDKRIVQAFPGLLQSQRENEQSRNLQCLCHKKKPACSAGVLQR